VERIRRVVLSGYGCDLYDTELYPDWQRVEKLARADGSLERVEVLWKNPAAAQVLAPATPQRALFQ
jgi:DNA adenine methylase